jgi:hypothetical protein
MGRRLSNKIMTLGYGNSLEPNDSFLYRQVINAYVSTPLIAFNSLRL